MLGIGQCNCLCKVIDRQTLTVCLEEAARAARAQGFAVQTPPSIQASQKKKKNTLPFGVKLMASHSRAWQDLSEKNVFRHLSNEKPTVIPGCSGGRTCHALTLLLHLLVGLNAANCGMGCILMV